MKTTIILLLITSLFFQSCKSEISLKNKQSNSEVQLNEKYCYVNDVKKANDKIFATLNFIEYKKKSEVDPSIKKAQVLELPNGFCYVNEKIKLESFEFSETTKIIMQTFSYNNDGNFNFDQSINLDELLKYFKKPESERLKFSPFRITLREAKIISLTEIYIP